MTEISHIVRLNPFVGALSARAYTLSTKKAVAHIWAEWLQDMRTV